MCSDHDAHVKFYYRRQVRLAMYEAAYTMAVHKMAMGRARIRRKPRWTWKNHLAHWINKAIRLVEKCGF